MKQFTSSLAKHLVKAVLYWAAGGVTAVLVFFILYLQRLPDLKIWHDAELEAEFTVNSPVSTFSEYINLENKLFNQLDSQILDRVEFADRSPINRFHRGGLSDPGRWIPNWNRTFEFAAETPKAGVLLVHGMSDSPYSLRHIGQTLHAEGFWVVGLRLPGHGTIPSGLVTATWQDMAGAVQLAVRHINEKTGARPLYLMGYSNGGALSVLYALSSIEDPELPQVDGLVLVSPSIGVSRIAALAKWQACLGRLPGLHKLSWNSILPEYDPFKYGSFAVNAGAQVYCLTTEIQTRLKKIREAGRLDDFPPVLAFQSVVDATVSTSALVHNLFEKLPAANHELVLFDINRSTDVELIRRKDMEADVNELFRNNQPGFSVSLVTNESEDSHKVIVRRKLALGSDILEIDPGLRWPKGIYSLSHIALPFPEKDALYGLETDEKSPGICLGNIELKGERGLLHIPAADLIRLRWNPFYPYLEQRLLKFVDLE